MADIEYVNEKLNVALECLVASDGNFEKRMFAAWVSALHVLGSRDTTAPFAEELNSVLILCTHHAVREGGAFRPFSEAERKRIASSLVAAFVETSRLTSDKDE